MNSPTLCSLLAGVCFGVSVSGVANAASFTTFDQQGSTATYPYAINDHGKIAGTFFDSQGVQHGFFRDRTGEITTFDVSDSMGTSPNSVNNNGAIVGSYYDSANVQHALIRTADGKIMSLDVKGSYGTAAASINDYGVIAGMYQVTPDFPHIFVRASDGTVTKLDIPEDRYAFVGSYSINNNGTIAGGYQDKRTLYDRGFVRKPDGKITVVDYPGAYQTELECISDDGTLAGSYNVDALHTHGFVEAPDGTTTSFDPIHSSVTSPAGINSEDEIVGTFVERRRYDDFFSFLRRPDGRIARFTVDESANAQSSAVSRQHIITGWYLDNMGNVHGFLRVP
jgi:uncharacterized membrane protein